MGKQGPPCCYRSECRLPAEPSEPGAVGGGEQALRSCYNSRMQGNLGGGGSCPGGHRRPAALALLTKLALCLLWGCRRWVPTGPADTGCGARVPLLVVVGRGLSERLSLEPPRCVPAAGPGQSLCSSWSRGSGSSPPRCSSPRAPRGPPSLPFQVLPACVSCQVWSHKGRACQNGMTDQKGARRSLEKPASLCFLSPFSLPVLEEHQRFIFLREKIAGLWAEEHQIKCKVTAVTGGLREGFHSDAELPRPVPSVPRHGSSYASQTGSSPKTRPVPRPRAVAQQSPPGPTCTVSRWPGPPHS